MTVGEWLVGGFVALLIVGAALFVRAWWSDRNGEGDR